MDENAIRQWLIDCFGPIQGEMAWNQLSNMPEAVRDQLMSQDPSTLPKPEEVKSMMQAFTAGGLNTMGDMQQAVEQGPINIKLAKSLALQQANGAGSDSSVNAETGEIARRAISEANLWLDTACEFNPAQGETQLLTRAGWVEDTIDAWAQFASPVAESMNDALASILSQRFGDGEIQTEISGVFAGPIEIPIPDEMKNPAKLMGFVGNTSFAMQLGRAAGDLRSGHRAAEESRRRTDRAERDRIREVAGHRRERSDGLSCAAGACACQAVRLRAVADAPLRGAAGQIRAWHHHRHGCHGGADP